MERKKASRERMEAAEECKREAEKEATKWKLKWRREDEHNKDLTDQLESRKQEQTRQLESHQGQDKAKQKVIDTLHK